MKVTELNFVAERRGDSSDHYSDAKRALNAGAELATRSCCSAWHCCKTGIVIVTACGKCNRCVQPLDRATVCNYKLLLMCVWFKVLVFASTDQQGSPFGPVVSNSLCNYRVKILRIAEEDCVHLHKLKNNAKRRGCCGHSRTSR